MTSPDTAAPPPRRHRGRLALLLPLVALVGALTIHRGRAQAQDPRPTPPPAAGAAPSAAAPTAPAPPPPPSPAAAPATGPRKVYVGVYAFQVPELDLSRSVYLIDFWAWFRWQGDDIDPTQTFEFLNLYEGWDVLKVPIYVDAQGAAKPDDLGDGWRYQVYRFQARFGRSFDVRAYPFDDQELTIAFEDNDQTVDQMIYVPDDGTEKVDPSLDIQGWEIDRVRAAVFERAYPTNWGDPRRPPGADRYAQFRYTIHIKRPVVGYLATTLLPIGIVMLITMVVFLIGSKYFEGRLGLAITTLISAVALQLTAQGDLPKTGYMVLLDHVYNLSYLTIFIALLESVIAVRAFDAGDLAQARRLDRLGLAAAATVFFGGTLVLVLLRV